MAEGKYLVFELANAFYGLPIENVERILPTQKPTRVPKAPEMFLGVFDLRGETVPAIDLRTRFEFEKREGESNFVVIHSCVGRCALRVDRVDGIVTLDESDINLNAEMLKHKGDDFIAGVGKNNHRLIVLMNCDHIVPQNLRGDLEQATAPAA